MTARRGLKKKLLLSLAALTLVAVAAWFIALPGIVRSRVTALTGCPVEAAAIRVNPFAGTARLEQFHLRNPAGFPAAEFVDLKLLDIDVSVLSLLGDELVIPYAFLELDRVTIVTRRDGVTNADAVRQHIDTVRGPAAAPAPDAEESPREFRIGELVVRIGTIELVDYSNGGAEPVRRTIALNADHRFQNVTDAKVIVRPLLADLALANAGNVLGTLGGMLPGPFRDLFGGSLDGAGGVLKKFIDSVPLGR